MAATLVLREYHGSSLNSSSYAATESAFRSSDTSDAYSSYAIPVPDAVATFAYSYELWWALVCSVAPDNSISNFQAWGETPSTGIRICLGSSDSAATPSDNESLIATDDVVDHVNAGDAIDWDMDSYTSVGDKTNYLVGQLRASSDASSGTDSIIIHYKFTEA